MWDRLISVYLNSVRPIPGEKNILKYDNKAEYQYLLTKPINAIKNKYETTDYTLRLIFIKRITLGCLYRLKRFIFNKRGSDRNTANKKY